MLLLEASDNGTVEIKLQLVRSCAQRAHQQDDTPTSEFVEVIGRVSRTGDSITQHALIPLGDNLGRSLTYARPLARRAARQVDAKIPDSLFGSVDMKAYVWSTTKHIRP